MFQYFPQCHCSTMSDLPCGTEEVNLQELDKTVPHPASGLYFKRFRLAFGFRRDSTALTRVDDDTILCRAVCRRLGAVCPVLKRGLVVGTYKTDSAANERYACWVIVWTYFACPAAVAWYLALEP